jgi:capsular exopolysaccharide synthesis family protein
LGRTPDVIDTGPLDLREYLALLWARRWIILLVAAVSTSVAALYSYRQTPVYTASAEVVVRPSSLKADQPSNAPGQVDMETEQQIANSTIVARLAEDRLSRTDREPESISASAVFGAETLVFTSTSPDPTSARATAQSYAEAYLEYRRTTTLAELDEARAPFEARLRDIDEQLAELARRIDEDPSDTVLSLQLAALFDERGRTVDTLTGFVTPETLNIGEVIAAARQPTSPSSPTHAKDVAIGLLVGLALGVAAAFARERLDERLRDRGDLELQSGAPVLAFVPRIRTEQPPPITATHPMSEVAESYKALRVRLLHEASERQLKTVLVTSSLAGEGKTSTTANLGVALAIGGKRTVMVSADLRRPTLHDYFSAKLSGGLTDVLEGRYRPFDVLRSTSTPNLWVVTSGSHSESVGPLEVLGSNTMRHMLVQLSQFADCILVDTPPVLTSPDIAALAPLVDGVLFVVDAHRVDRVTVEHARHELHLMGAPIVGVVVNNHTPGRFRTYGGSYGRYRYSTNGAEHSAAATPPSRLAARPEGDERADK